MQGPLNGRLKTGFTVHDESSHCRTQRGQPWCSLTNAPSPIRLVDGQHSDVATVDPAAVLVQLADNGTHVDTIANSLHQVHKKAEHGALTQPTISCFKARTTKRQTEWVCAFTPFTTYNVCVHSICEQLVHRYMYANVTTQSDR